MKSRRGRMRPPPSLFDSTLVSMTLASDFRSHVEQHRVNKARLHSGQNAIEACSKWHSSRPLDRCRMLQKMALHSQKNSKWGFENGPRQLRKRHVAPKTIRTLTEAACGPDHPWPGRTETKMDTLTGGAIVATCEFWSPATPDSSAFIPPPACFNAEIPWSASMS